MADAEEHSHGEGFWEEYLHLVTDGPHILFELTYNLLFDLIVVALLYGVVLKKIIIPKLKKQINRDIHESHGLDDDCLPDSTEK